jgi:hypothetical protein
VGRERETEIGLREREDATAKDTGHILGHLITDVHRDEGGFVEIDVKPGGEREAIQDSLVAHNISNVTLDQYKSVIGVLENGAREFQSEG